MRKDLFYIILSVIVLFGVVLYIYRPTEEEVVADARTFEYRIEEDTDSGYEWDYDFDVKGIVEVTKDVTENGFRIYNFKALKSGEVIVTFISKRSWIEDDATDRRILVLEVDEDLNINEIK